VSNNSVKPSARKKSITSRRQSSKSPHQSARSGKNLNNDISALSTTKLSDIASPQSRRSSTKSNQHVLSLSKSKSRTQRTTQRESSTKKTHQRELSINRDSYVQRLEQQNSLLESELLPIREKNSELMQQVFKLQYEIEQNKRNESAKMTELTNNFAQL
jgi:hypothetical protein